MIAAFPTLSEIDKKNLEIFVQTQRRLFYGILASAFVACAVAAFYAKEIVLLIFTNSYSASVLIFRVMVWLLFFSLMRNTLGLSLQAAGFQRQHMIASLGGLLSMVMGGTILTYYRGAFGATLALVLADMITAAGMLYYYNDIIRNRAIEKRSNPSHEQKGYV